MKTKIKALLIHWILCSTLLLACSKELGAQVITPMDTISVGSSSTVHLIFHDQIIYLDLSSEKEIGAKISSSGKNMLAVRAKSSFEGDRSLLVMLSSGVLHPFILRWDQAPKEIIKDFREESKQNIEKEDDSTLKNTLHSNALPYQKRPLNHLGCCVKGLTLLLEDIEIDSKGNTSLYLSLKNESKEEFSPGNMTFLRRQKERLQKSLSIDKEIVPLSIEGSLECKPSDTSYQKITFKSLSISKKEYLEISLFEKDLFRILSFRIYPKDIDRASKK